MIDNPTLTQVVHMALDAAIAGPDTGDVRQKSKSSRDRMEYLTDRVVEAVSANFEVSPKATSRRRENMRQWA